MLAPIELSCFLEEKVFSKNLGNNRAMFKFITPKKCTDLQINGCYQGM